MKYLQICICVAVPLMIFVQMVLYQQVPRVPGRFLRLYEYSNKGVQWPGIYLAEKKMACFPDNTVTVQSVTRLGNQILEYASVWSIARLYGLKPFIPDEVINRMTDVFERLSVPTFGKFLKKETSCAVGEREVTIDDVIGPREKMDHKIHSFDTIVERARKTHTIILLEAYNMLWETIAPLAPQLHEEFRYKSSLVEEAQRSLSTFRDKLLNGENESHGGHVLYIGIHVRRSDCDDKIPWLYNVTEQAGVEYYRHAVHWMRTTLWEDNARVPLSIVFVVTTDDPDWSKKVLIPALRGVDLDERKQKSTLSDNMGTFDVFWGGQEDETTPEQDLVLLSSCNHSIFSYGAYGIWGALMAGGRTVVYDTARSEGNRHVRGNTPAMLLAEHIEKWVVLS